MIYRKWQLAKNQSEESEKDFLTLSETLSIEKIQQWSSEEKNAQERRDIDISAMDIYDVKSVEGN